MMELLASSHWRVRWDVGRRLVLMARSSIPFASAAEIDSSFAAVHNALSGFARASTAILIDLREGAARNDPDFEAAFGEHRRRMLEGFERIAVIVRTATGKLQVQRHLAEDQIAAGVFLRDDEAFGHLARTSTIPPPA